MNGVTSGISREEQVRNCVSTRGNRVNRFTRSNDAEVVRNVNVEAVDVTREAHTRRNARLADDTFPHGVVGNVKCLRKGVEVILNRRINNSNEVRLRNVRLLKE
jgi:hypothetical protein